MELAERVAGLPRKAMLETKRRTLLERRHLWGFLFEDEQRVFRRALMGRTRRKSRSEGRGGVSSAGPQTGKQRDIGRCPVGLRRTPRERTDVSE